MGAQVSAVVDVSHPVRVKLETLLLELCQMSIVTHVYFNCIVSDSLKVMFLIHLIMFSIQNHFFTV